MKCTHCKSEWNVAAEFAASITKCPFCGKPLAKEINTDSVEGVFAAIYQEFGETGLRNGKNLRGYFADMAPERKKERLILSHFVSCEGHTILLDAKLQNADPKMYIERIVYKMTDELLLSEEISRSICEKYWIGIGGGALQQHKASPRMQPQPEKSEFPAMHFIPELQPVECDADFKIDGGVLLVAYTGTDSHPRIPSGIAEIGDNAFAENKYIQKIVIPEGVVKIGAAAFSGCSELRDVHLPQSLKEIGMFAFADCPIEEIHLPPRLESLGEEGAFIGTDLKRVVIPGSIRVVPLQTFSRCYMLKEVILEEGITELKKEAFNRCSNLETIHIPDSLTRIADGTKKDESAFYRCHKLSNVVASEKWKRAHSHLLQLLLPISQADLQWCTEAAMQGSLDDMHKLIHWYKVNRGTATNAWELNKWTEKEKFISWSQDLFALGNRYYWTSEEKDRADGIERHMELAQQGDAYAQLWIGDCYFFGRGVAKNKAEAVKWYQKAAKQGYAEAQYWLGYCYANGFGVKQNSAKARQLFNEALFWFLKAAARGYGREQTMLGECFFWGYGISENRVTATSWFHKAAATGYADAQYWLGICYAGGHGVTQNLAESNKWYLEAARNGHAGAYAICRKKA